MTNDQPAGEALLEAARRLLLDELLVLLPAERRYDGLMIANASQYVDTYPWEILLPAMTMVIIVLCFSFLGDGLRDAFDPRSKD